MPYTVKEIFYTLQGEGANTGRAAVFCRFAGCNLWTGREEDRAKATCQFCDTDFVGANGPGGGRFKTADQLADAVLEKWPLENGSRPGKPMVVCTGGEPLLQLDPAAIAAFHARGIHICIETNGTILPPPDIDWICVSPKAGAKTILTRGDELKLVFPQPSLMPDAVESWDFKHYFLQPMDGLRRVENTKAAVEYCMQHPKWRVSLQTHKLLGIP
jgi:7-carboxy-7-deazaguanine synthase (Cx14CxxC type)